ncbi:copper amine oxidase N-terminal domain-containing protein [Cytobacillus depressus]|uniref:copper amine oxidase N-terminal domain-containing protein n=1 Tax=Cytobacillus depressus TaxID=1602942 RepID=UPI0014794036|nr:copper amine oxidase N-terminal domain-containing protein [Cytobacillus depressus]
MIKRLTFALVAVFAITIFLASNSASANDDIKVFLNNEEVKLDQKPVIKNGRTLVPIRFATERLGGEVNWDQKGKVVTIKNNGYITALPIGQKTVTVSHMGEVNKIQLDVPVQLINGRTVVPLRFVGGILGVDVRWDFQYKDVYLSKTGMNLIPSDFEKNIYNKELRKIKDFGKPTVNYEKFLAMNLEKADSMDNKYLFAQEPEFDFRVDIYHFKDFHRGLYDFSNSITVFSYPTRVVYYGNDLPKSSYPGVSEENYATIKEGMTYEEVIKIFGGPGAMNERGKMAEGYVWLSPKNEGTAQISFIKKDNSLQVSSTKWID